MARRCYARAIRASWNFRGLAAASCAVAQDAIAAAPEDR